jgi:hypothetical protein
MSGAERIAPMTKLHITQDNFGFWQLSIEDNDGSLRLLAHHSETQAHLVENAHDLVEEGKYPDAVVIVDPPRATTPALAAAAAAYRTPPPRRAGE